LLGSDLAPVAVPMRDDLEERQRQDMQSRLAAFFKGEPLPQHAPAPLLPLPPGEGRGEGVFDVRAPAPTTAPPHPSPLPVGEGTAARLSNPTEGTRAIQLH